MSLQAWLCERCRLLEDQAYALRVESRAVHLRAEQVKEAQGPKGKAQEEGRVPPSRKEELRFQEEKQQLESRVQEVQRALAASKARVLILERELKARPKAVGKQAGVSIGIQTEADSRQNELETTRAHARADMEAACVAMGRSAVAIRALEGQLVQAQAEANAALAQCAVLLQAHSSLEARYSSVCTSLAVAEDVARAAQASATRAREERDRLRAGEETDRERDRREQLSPAHPSAPLPSTDHEPNVTSSGPTSAMPVADPAHVQAAGIAHTSTSTGTGRSPWRKERGTTARYAANQVKGTTPVAQSHPLKDSEGHTVGILREERANAVSDELQGPPLSQTPMNAQ